RGPRHLLAANTSAMRLNWDSPAPRHATGALTSPDSPRATAEWHAQTAMRAGVRRWRRLLLGPLVALALLIMGEAAPAAFPVRVVLEANNQRITVQVDGSVHVLSPDKRSPWAHLRLFQPDPTQREYQIDGSDVTSRKDRDP